jgi:hypothetical protein
LLQLDFDGKKSISPVVMATALPGSDIPEYLINIQGNIISIVFQESIDRDVGVMVVDAEGKLISHDRLGKPAAGEGLEFDIPMAKSGWYAVVLQFGTTIQTEKMFFVK